MTQDQMHGSIPASPAGDGDWQRPRSADWDLYRALRDQWTHEDDVMNHRLMWLILSQGLVFTAYSTLSRAGHRLLIVAFPFFGITVAAVVGASIFAAVQSTAVVERRFDEADLERLCSLAPSSRTTAQGRLAGQALPFVFGTLWLLALITSL